MRARWCGAAQCGSRCWGCVRGRAHQRGRRSRRSRRSRRGAGVDAPAALQRPTDHRPHWSKHMRKEVRASTRARTSARTSPDHLRVSQALLEAWQALLVNRARPYALQQADGTYRWVYESLGPELLLAHLRGDCTLAASSTDAAGRCRWLCLDADQTDALPHLLKVAAALAELGLPGLVEASRRGVTSGFCSMRRCPPMPLVTSCSTPSRTCAPVACRRRPSHA